MRGKTNIPPRKQPVINGETNNFVVAVGNTITKGDFVSYVLNNDYIQVDGRTMELVYKNEYDEVNHKFVLAFNVTGASPIVMLAQVANGSFTILDSVTVTVGASRKFVGAFTDGTYVYTCEAPTSFSSTTATINIVKYSVTNDELTLVQSYAPTLSVVSSYHYPLGFAVVGTKVYFICRVAYSSSQHRVYAYYAELGDNFTSASVTLVSAAPTTGTFVANLYVRGNYLIAITSVLAASSSGTSLLSLQVVNSTDNTLTNVNLGTGSDEWRASDMVGSRLCLVTKTNVKFLEYDSGSFTMVYNVAQASNVVTAVVGRVSQNEYVVYSVGVGTTLYKLGETIQTVVNTLNSIAGVNGKNQYILSDFTTHILLECSSQYGLIEYFGGLDEQQGFVLGEPTNYVQEYNGGYTVGFAKTSGTGGDTIQVYTPLSS